MAILDHSVRKVEYGANYHVDPSVLKGALIDSEFRMQSSEFRVQRICLIGVEFPEGAKVLEASRYSTAAWTTALRVIVELQDGKKQSYFLKV